MVIFKELKVLIKEGNPIVHINHYLKVQTFDKIYVISLNIDFEQVAGKGVKTS